MAKFRCAERSQSAASEVVNVGSGDDRVETVVPANVNTGRLETEQDAGSKQEPRPCGPEGDVDRASGRPRD